MAYDGHDSLYIADLWNEVIRKVTLSTGIITTVAGVGTVWGYSGDGGPATSAHLYFPGGVAVDSHEDLYIADTFNQRIRKVDHSTGIISTVAGTGTTGFNGDGGIASSARLAWPENVEFDVRNNLYIADSENHRIRMVDYETGIISTIAGTGIPGFSGDDDTATDAQIKGPKDVVFDKRGYMYIADNNNFRIRKVVIESLAQSYNASVIIPILLLNILD